MQIFQQIKKKAKQIASWHRLEKSIKPTHNFDNKPLPKAPDYSDLSSWMAHPLVNSNVYFTQKECLEMMLGKTVK